MKRTLISSKASNWVDRGEQPNTTMRKVLAHFFERLEPADHAWLDEHVLVTIGMVAADATEVHVSGYLRSVVRDAGLPLPAPLDTRTTAIALWHIAKAALVRDAAERLLNADIDLQSDRLSHWVASRLLSPDELRRFEEEVRENEQHD
ncbi:MAG TPA: hypothetical protein VIP11_22900 [Gemmatimonadaceae bacterium]